jgi:hypothetical protein
LKVAFDTIIPNPQLVGASVIFNDLCLFKKKRGMQWF